MLVIQYYNISYIIRSQSQQLKLVTKYDWRWIDLKTLLSYLKIGFFYFTTVIGSRGRRFDSRVPHWSRTPKSGDTIHPKSHSTRVRTQRILYRYNNNCLSGLVKSIHEYISLTKTSERHIFLRNTCYRSMYEFLHWAQEYMWCRKLNTRQ